jgi:hypothetical protein
MRDEQPTGKPAQKSGWANAGQMLRTKMKKARVNGKMLARHLLWHEHGISKCLNGHQGFPVEHLTSAVVYLMAHGAIFEPHEVRDLFSAYTTPINDAELLDIADQVSRFREAGLHPNSLNAIAVKFKAALATQGSLPESGTLRGNEQPQPATSSSPSSVEAVSPDMNLTGILTAWQKQVAEITPNTGDDRLDPDEVLTITLAWESHLSDPELAAPLWDWLADDRMQVLRYRPRLEFCLNRLSEGESPTWNRLEWQWLDHALFETTRRHAGKPHASPGDVDSLISSLGAIALSAIRLDTAHQYPLVIGLEAARKAMPAVQGNSWGWLEHIAEVGLLQLDVAAGQCQFLSREVAEFLAAQFLLQPVHESELQSLVKNCGRPHGVLLQAVRILRFGGNEQRALQLVHSRM